MRTEQRTVKQTKYDRVNGRVVVFTDGVMLTLKNSTNQPQPGQVATLYYSHPEYGPVQRLDIEDVRVW